MLHTFALVPINSLMTSPSLAYYGTLTLLLPLTHCPLYL